MSIPRVSSSIQSAEIAPRRHTTPSRRKSSTVCWVMVEPTTRSSGRRSAGGDGHKAVGDGPVDHRCRDPKRCIIHPASSVRRRFRRALGRRTMVGGCIGRCSVGALRPLRRQGVAADRQARSSDVPGSNRRIRRRDCSIGAGLGAGWALGSTCRCRCVCRIRFSACLKQVHATEHLGTPHRDGDLPHGVVAARCVVGASDPGGILARL